jgi:flagellar biosynthesis/type III secretory pathway protein FliH
MLKDIKFKKENDPFYQLGYQKGYQEGLQKGYLTKVVTNLLLAGKFTISEIANFASVDEAFVKEVCAKLKN